MAKLMELKPISTNVPEESGLSPPTLKFDLMTSQLYDTEQGNFVREDESFLGKKMSLYFDGGVVRMGEDTLNLVGSFPLFLGPNQVEVKDMDAESHAQAMAQVNFWLTEAGSMEGTELWKKIQSAQVPLQAAFQNCGIKLDNGQEMLLLNLLTVALNDTFDEHKKSGMNFDLLMDSVSILSSTILGEDFDQDFASTTPFPRFPMLLALCQKLREMFENRGVDKCHSVIVDIVEYIEAQAWELDQWWKDCVSEKAHPKGFYFIRKQMTVGIKMRMELVAVYRNIVVHSKVRRDPLFELMKRQLAKICVSAEAILSLRKCLEDKIDNCLIMRTRKKTLAQAMDRTLLELRASIEDFCAFEVQLNIKFNDTPMVGGLNEFCTIGKSVVDAHLMYLFVSKIYGEFKVHVEMSSK